jgi:CheY-like chemotaxis protein
MTDTIRRLHSKPQLGVNECYRDFSPINLLDVGLVRHRTDEPTSEIINSYGEFFKPIPTLRTLGKVRRTMTVRPRILIADDHNLVAELFRRLLAGDFDVVGTVGDGHALVRAAVELKPDLIVIDVGMPLLNGLDAGRQVKKLQPMVKLVYMTISSAPEVAAEAFMLGASGYLLKTCAASEMTLAVHEVLRGKTYLSKAMSRSRWGTSRLAIRGFREKRRTASVMLRIPGHPAP